MTPIRTLIVDDEPLARERIRTLLAEHSSIEVIAECATGREALTAMVEKRPDLVFLDVQMPEMDGFEVLESVERADWPIVIFVTAYDQYALRAFDVHALDYLLKPFDRTRFDRAVRRAESELRDRRSSTTTDARLAALIEQLKLDRQRPRRLVVKSGGRIFFVKFAEIDWVEAAGNYVKLHVGPSEHLVRDTMKNVAERLEGLRFVRIHRSILVNPDRICELRQAADGGWEVVLADGTRLSAGRDADSRLKQVLGKA
jgi:two-component system LytT family response regulator